MSLNAIEGRFFMVCRDAKTHKAAPINQLKLSTDEDKQLFALGESKLQTSPRSMLILMIFVQLTSTA